MQEKHEKHFFVLLCPENNKKIPSLDQENSSLSGKFFFSQSGKFPQLGQLLSIDEKCRTDSQYPIFGKQYIVIFMESSKSTWTCRLLKAKTIRVFTILFWLKCTMCNISVNQSQFALFVAKLKNLNQMEKNLLFEELLLMS